MAIHEIKHMSPGFEHSSNVNVKDECGLVKDKSKGRETRSISAPSEAADFMINAVNAIHGKNPWHASISDRSPLNYDFCGATLISKMFLVTGVCAFNFYQ
jgi:hypothetical protein